VLTVMISLTMTQARCLVRCLVVWARVSTTVGVRVSTRVGVRVSTVRVSTRVGVRVSTRVGVRVSTRVGVRVSTRVGVRVSTRVGRGGLAINTISAIKGLNDWRAWNERMLRD
jgi:hypothetical protein